MDTILKKTCVGCGTDVSQQKRVKDQQGRYFCHPCWETRAPSSGSSSTPSAPAHDELQAAAGMRQPVAVAGPPNLKFPTHTDAPPVVHAATGAGTSAVMTEGASKPKSPDLLHKDLTDNAFFHAIAGPWFIILAAAGFLFQIYWPFAAEIGVGGLLLSGFIIVTSIGIAIDAAIARVPILKEKPYNPILNGWLRWLAGSLWLWIFVAPYYLFCRLNNLNKSPQPAGHGQIAATDLETELRKLRQLVEEGLLTEEEFSVQKRGLLNTVNSTK